MLMRSWTVCLLLVAACGGAGAPPPEPARQPEEAPPPPEASDPFAVTGELSRETLPEAPPSFPLERRELPPGPAGLPKPPKVCRAFAERRAKASSCADQAAALDGLDRALAKTEPAAPLFGSFAPYTSRPTRAWIIAPTHMLQGSRVT